MVAQVAAITNLTTLKAAIASEVDRSDIDTTIGLWPAFCEAEVNRKLRHFSMLAEVDIPGFGTNRVPLPTDWQDSRNVRVDGRQVTYTTPDILDMERGKVLDGATEPLYPCFFTHFGAYLEIWPYPSEEYTVTLQYYQSIPPLALQTSGTNWLLARAPALYFYGCLKHSAPFLDDDQRIALWSKLFNDEMMELQGASDMAQVSGSRLSRRPPMSFG
jgi:hypothetical protein